MASLSRGSEGDSKAIDPPGCVTHATRDQPLFIPRAMPRSPVPPRWPTARGSRGRPATPIATRPIAVSGRGTPTHAARGGRGEEIGPTEAGKPRGKCAPRPGARRRRRPETGMLPRLSDAPRLPPRDHPGHGRSPSPGPPPICPRTTDPDNRRAGRDPPRAATQERRAPRSPSIAARPAPPGLPQEASKISTRPP